MPPQLLAPLRRVTVVGAGLAGGRSCEQLRAQGFDGQITLVGRESRPPYDRPPLSKAVLMGKRDDTDLGVDLGKLEVDVRLGVSAIGIRSRERVVRTSDGDIEYDGLVIATGAVPVRLPGTGTQHTVRSLEDAHALRECLAPGARVVIVGASWIGAEVATAALSLGCQVSCVEAGSAPIGIALGDRVGRKLLPWWTGIDLRLEATVADIVDGAVHLADGSQLPADVVVVGVGVRPAIQWLRDSGLEVDRGVVVDERLAAADNVVAVGDVAAFWSRRYGRRLRVEHWDNAGAAPAVAVATLLNPGDPDGPIYDPVPYFWSDQFGHKLQYVGHHDDGCEPVIRTDPETGRWACGWLDAASRMVAMLVVDRPRDLMEARKLIMSAQPVDRVRLADGTVPLAQLLAPNP